MRTPAAIFISLCAVLTGCQTYNPVIVVVSDEQRNPVSGASVQASPMYFFNPTSNNYIIVGPYDIFEPFPSKGDAGITGEDGCVQLEIVSENPLELNVFAENHSPWKGQIAITKQGDVEINPYFNESSLQITSN